MTKISWVLPAWSGAMTLLSVGLLVWLLTSHWRVKTIHCLVETKPCPDEIRQDLDQLLGSSLLFFNHSDSIEQTLLNHSLELSRLSRTLPDTLVLELSRVEQRFQFETDQGWHVVHEQGYVVQTEQPRDLPIVQIGNQETIQPSLIKELGQLVATTSQQNLAVQSISLQPMAIEIVLDAGPIALLPREAAAQKVPPLAAILTELPELDLPPITKIDLRFDRPVLQSETEPIPQPDLNMPQPSQPPAIEVEDAEAASESADRVTDT